jgi:hypothetical protein
MRSAGNFNSEWGYLAPAPSFMRTARVVLVATAIGATAGAAVVLSLIDRPSPERGRTAAIAAHAIVTSVQAEPATATAATLAAPVSTAVAARPIVAPAVQAPSPAPAAPPVKATAAPPPVAPQVAMQPPPAATEPAAAPPVASEAAIGPPRAGLEPNVTPAAPSQASIEPPVATNRPAAGNSAALESSAAGAADTPWAPKSTSGLASLSYAPSATESAPAEAPEALIPPQSIPPVKKPKPHYASNSKYQAPNLGTLLRRLFSQHNRTSYYPNR